MAYTVSRWISDDTLNRKIHIESNGDPDAVAPNGNATGLMQFIRSTWRTMVKRHRPDLLHLPDAELLALRKDPQLAIELGARLTEDEARQLGPGATDGQLYLSHFAGIVVAMKLLRAPRTDPCDKYFSKAAIEANRSVLLTKIGVDKNRRPIYGRPARTVGQVIDWAERKMAGAGGHNYVAQFWRGGFKLPTEPPVDAPDDPPAPVDLDQLAASIERPAVEPVPRDPPIDGEEALERARQAADSIVEGAADRARRELDADRIIRVKRQLREMDYHEVGDPDDLDIGTRSLAAVAAFAAARGLPGQWTFDRAFADEVERAWRGRHRRPIGDARANATARELAPKNRTLLALARQKLLQLVAGATAAVTALYNAVVKFVGDDWTVLRNVGDWFGQVPLWAWFGLGAAGLLYGWELSRRGERDTVDKYRRGELL